MLKLRQVELIRPPPDLIVIYNSPIVSGLTSLTLIGGTTLLPTHAINSLLLFNPRLESLHLDRGAAPSPHHESISNTQNRVQLSFLHSLSLNSVSNPHWGLQLLQLIDAPRLKNFALHLGALTTTTASTPDANSQYISAGRLSNILQLHHESPNHDSIFPCLNHLDTQHTKADSEVTLSLFSAFCTVKEIILNQSSLTTWAERPLLLPGVSHIIILQDGDLSDDLFIALTIIISQRANSRSVTRIASIEISIAKHERVYNHRLGCKQRYIERSIKSLRQSVDRFVLHTIEPVRPFASSKTPSTST